MELMQSQILTQNSHQAIDRGNLIDGSTVANHRGFADFKVGNSEIGGAVGVELIHIAPHTGYIRKERDGQLKGIKHQVFIFYQHT